jgi:hypothetical protein
MRMGGKPCHNRLAQFTKVVREGGHFVAVHPGVDEQHTGPAVYDDGVALAELALVDQHTRRDLPQHGGSFRLLAVPYRATMRARFQSKPEVAMSDRAAVPRTHVRWIG